MENSYNQQLINLRRHAGLKLTSAAKLIGVSSFKLFLYENGYYRPKGKSLEKIETFYGVKIDFECEKDYPGPFNVFIKKKEKPIKKKLIVSGIVAFLSLALTITGSSLFGASARNKISLYGDTYTQMRDKTIETGKVGRDLVTDLEYYYLDADRFAGKGAISFFSTNSMLYFNNCDFTCNSGAEDRPDLGVGRFRYQFGGTLANNSYKCSFTFASYKVGLYFTCEVIYQGKLIDHVDNIRVITEETVTVDQELAVFLFNQLIVDVTDLFSIILSTALEREVDFYKDFLPAREQGRIANFNTQIAGLALSFPSIIIMFIALAIFLLSLVSRSKSFLNSIENEGAAKEENKPLPKDIRSNVWIPDFVINWVSNIVLFGSFFLLILCYIGRFILTLPPLLLSEDFLHVLHILLITSVFINQIVAYNATKKEKPLFMIIIRFALLYLFVATAGTALFLVFDEWGYSVADIVYKYIPSNIFFAYTLESLIFLFLFFKPKFIKKGSFALTVIWRLLSIIPLGILIASVFVGNGYNLFYGVKKNIYLLFWFSSSNVATTLIIILFLYITFFIKLFFQKRYGEHKSPAFYNGNIYTFISNGVAVVLITAISLLDLIFKQTEIGYYLGLGDNLWLLFLIPFIALTRTGPNSIEINHIDDENTIQIV